MNTPDGAIFDDPADVESTGGWNFGPLGGLLDTAVNVTTGRLRAQEAPTPQQVTQPAPLVPTAWQKPALILGAVIVILLLVVGLVRGK